MNIREHLLRLLYIAFVEIRTEAYEKQNNKVFCIADIFHNLPLQLERAEKGEITYDEVFSELKSKANEKDCEQHFESLLKNASA